MDVIELIDKISLIEKEIYNYIIDTEHWLFYWIENKEVQNFIKEYPEDYNNRVHLHIIGISAIPFFRIKFDDHPNDIEYIERFANLNTFRNSVKAAWLRWDGKVKELQIKEKEEELAYHKDKVDKIEKEILELKML